MKRLRSSGTVSGIDPSGSIDVLQQITDMLRGVQSDVSQIIIDYNKEVFSTIGTLPQGKAETRWRLSTDDINPRLNNLDGANVFVDTEASSVANGGRFWLSNANVNRPKTLKEALLDLYTTLTNSIDQLRAEIAAIGQGNPVVAYNTSLTTANVVEEDVRSIVFDGSTVSATSIGTNAIRVVSAGGSGGGGGSSANIRGPRIVVGNSLEGDTTDDCDYLDVGNGANLQAAITAAGVLDPSGDVWIRPGLYDFSIAGGPSTGISIPVGVKVRAAGRQSVTVRGNSSGEITIFSLSNNAELEDLTVEVPLPTASCSGDGAIQLNGDRSETRFIVVEFLDVASYTTTEAGYMGIFAGFYVGQSDIRIRITDCGVGLDNNAPQLDSLGGLLRGIRIDEMQASIAADISRCRIVGTDRAIEAARTVRVNNCEIEDPSEYAIRIAGSDSQVTDCWIEFNPVLTTQVAIEVRSAARRSDVSNNFIQARAGGGTCRAIYLNGADDAVVSGNRGTNWTTSIEMTSFANNNIVLGNRLEGTITDAGSGNDVAHNITS